MCVFFFLKKRSSPLLQATLCNSGNFGTLRRYNIGAFSLDANKSAKLWLAGLSNMQAPSAGQSLSIEVALLVL